MTDRLLVLQRVEQLVGPCFNITSINLSRCLSVDHRSTEMSIVPLVPLFMLIAVAVYRSGVPMVWAETATAISAVKPSANANGRDRCPNGRGMCALLEPFPFKGCAVADSASATVSRLFHG